MQMFFFLAITQRRQLEHHCMFHDARIGVNKCYSCSYYYYC